MLEFLRYVGLRFDARTLLPPVRDETAVKLRGEIPGGILLRGLRRTFKFLYYFGTLSLRIRPVPNEFERTKTFANP